MSKWPEAPLLEVAHLLRGTEPGSATYTDHSHGVRFLRVGDVTGKADKPVFTDSRQLVLVGESDLLLTLDGSPGHVRTGHKGAISSGIRLVKPADPTRVTPEWLKYSLMSPDVQETIRRHTTGMTIFHASAALPHIRVPIPPMTEQARIVGVLEEAEALCRLRSEAESRLERVVPAVFCELFGDPTANSKGLPTVRLGDIAKLERGRFTPRPRNDPAYFGGPYPFIQTGDISTSGGLLSRWEQTLNERGKAVSKEFPIGTIVFAIVGATIGATAILQVPVFCPDSIIGIQVDQARAITEYVEFVLRARRPLLLSQAPYAARANLNLEIVRGLEIPLAPLRDQARFLALTLRLRELSDAQRASSRRVNELFDSLLYRAFRGDL